YDAFSGGEESPLAPPSIQFADFAHWQRHWQSHSEVAAQLDYWREQLRDPLPVMQLARRAPTRAIDDLRTARRGGEGCVAAWGKLPNALAMKRVARCSWRSSPP